MYYVLTTHKFDLNTKKGSTALSVQDNTDTVEITTTNESLFLFYFYVLLCSFLYFFYTNILIQCVVLSQRSLCNLHASIGKETTVIVSFSAGIYMYMFSYTQVVVQERSNLIWRPNIFMNSCQFKSKIVMMNKKYKQ